MPFPTPNGFGIVENPLVFSPFGQGSSNPFPFGNNLFLLMDGTDFLLQDNTNFLLMGT